MRRHLYFQDLFLVVPDLDQDRGKCRRLKPYLRNFRGQVDADVPHHPGRIFETGNDSDPVDDPLVPEIDVENSRRAVTVNAPGKGIFRAEVSRDKLHRAGVAVEGAEPSEKHLPPSFSYQGRYIHFRIVLERPDRGVVHLELEGISTH